MQLLTKNCLIINLNIWIINSDPAIPFLVKNSKGVPLQLHQKEYSYQCLLWVKQKKIRREQILNRQENE